MTLSFPAWAVGVTLLGPAAPPDRAAPTDEPAPVLGSEATPVDPQVEPQEVAPSEFPRTRVVVGVRGDDRMVDAQTLDVVLGGVLADTGLSREVVSLPSQGPGTAPAAWAANRAGERDVLVVFWIDVAGDDCALFMYEVQARRMWVRRLAIPADSDALLETLGLVLRSYSVAAGEGPPAGMDEVVAPEPGPAPPPSEPKSEPEPRPTPPEEPPPSPARFGWSLGAGYAGGSLARSVPWQHGAGLDAELRWRDTVAFSIGATWFAAVRPSGDPPTRVWRMPIEVLAGYRFRPGAALRPMVGAAVVLEPLWWDATSVAGARAVDGRLLRVAAAVAADLQWRLWRGLGLQIRARVDLWVVNADLVVSQGDRRDVRLRAYPATVTALAGLFFAFD